jgi:hypothetical protein
MEMFAKTNDVTNLLQSKPLRCPVHDLWKQFAKWTVPSTNEEPLTCSYTLASPQHHACNIALACLESGDTTGQPTIPCGIQPQLPNGQRNHNQVKMVEEG